MDPEREGDVEEDSALSTDVLLVIARTARAGSPVHRGGVSAALGSGVSPQSDVAVLSPPGAPGVPHDPVISQAGPWAGLSSVADQLDGWLAKIIRSYQK